MTKAWPQGMAIAFCTLVEEIAPSYGCHVALTGGCLYKTESRKDLDILFYRVRQTPEINKLGLFLALQDKLGVTVVKHVNGWITKAKWNNRNIDFFFPEEEGPRDTRDNVKYDEDDDG